MLGNRFSVGGLRTATQAVDSTPAPRQLTEFSHRLDGSNHVPVELVELLGWVSTPGWFDRRPASPVSRRDVPSRSRVGSHSQHHSSQRSSHSIAMRPQDNDTQLRRSGFLPQGPSGGRTDIVGKPSIGSHENYDRRVIDDASEIERELAASVEEDSAQVEAKKQETSGDSPSVPGARGAVEQRVARGALGRPQGIAAALESQARLTKMLAGPQFTTNIVNRMTGAEKLLERFAKMNRPWPEETLLAKVAALQTARTLGISSQFSDVIRARELVVGTSYAKSFTGLQKQALITERLLAGFQVEPSMAALMISAKPVIRYDSWLKAIDVQSSAGRAAAETHSFAINGLVARDSLLVEEDDEGGLDVVVETIETEIIAPWRVARDASGHALYLRVGKHDTTAVALLQEGWHNIGQPGPAALSSASNASLEALSRTLRAVAPDDAVRLWAARDGGLAVEEIEQNGRITRSARVRFLMRGRKKERKLVLSQIQALDASVGELISRLNAGKHASVGDMHTAQTNLMVTEAVLSALLPDVD